MRKKKLVDESWEQKDACTSHKFRICGYRATQSLVVLRSDSSPFAYENIDLSLIHI